MAWRPTGVAVERLNQGIPHGVEVDGVPVVLLRLGTTLFAVGGTCPHEGGDLSEATVGDGRLVCPLHGATFDVRRGDVLIDPHGAEPPSGTTAPLSVYRVRVTADAVEVDLLDRPGG